jgi:hypothetical protein
VSLAQVWIRYNVRWTQHMTLFCKVYLHPILKNQIWKESIYLNWILNLQVWTHYKITWTQLINIVPHLKSKSHHINSIKFELSRSFQQHQRHITILIRANGDILSIFHLWRNKNANINNYIEFQQRRLKDNETKELRRPREYNIGDKK